jgi:hypothetical protein
LDLKISVIGLSHLSRGFGATPKNILFNRSKGFELADFQLAVKKLLTLNGSIKIYQTVPLSAS